MERFLLNWIDAFTNDKVFIEMRMLCFTCSACCFWCPNPGLEELGERQIECEECWYNTGHCKDCLFIHSPECEKSKENEQ